MTSKGDKGLDSPTGHQPGPRETPNMTHLHLAYNREEQILTKTVFGTEDNEDERRDQVQQSALGKQRGDPVAKGSTCTDPWVKLGHVTYDVSCQIGIEPTR